VKSDLGCEFIELDDLTSVITKILDRPSSVDYLRKYGLWYARFHPIHILGDAASLVSLLVLFVAPLLAVVGSLAALGLLIVPVLGPVTYLCVKTFPGRRRLRDFEFIHLFVLPRFFVLGITAAEQLLDEGDYDWNYGGFDDQNQHNEGG
jgi:hypothetical protein